MDKMNQVSVTEFMSKSKEEMYDAAVEVVEKCNRLIDICNSSIDIMAELRTKNDTYASALIAEHTKIKELEEKVKHQRENLVACYKTNKTLRDAVKARDKALMEKNCFTNKLIAEVEFYKEQERIRTDQLRATESKVEELYKQIKSFK